MLTTFLMFIAAVVLSTIAGYYSVIGMTAIFSGAFIPIVVMAGTLETSKVIVASWLYNNWRKTPFLLKSYLTAAVVVLMFITSMGIFGFLSKAHIQQSAAGAQATAQIERLAQEIDTQNKIVEMATKRMNDLMSGGQGGDAGLNARITQANKLIETANARIQPQIDEQQRIIDQENAKVESRVKDIQTQIDDVDKEVAGLDDIIKGLVDQQRSVLAQKKKAEQAPDRDKLAKKKASLLKEIDAARNAPNPTVDAAKAEMAKIRAAVDAEVKQARDVINELTGQLGKNVDTTKLQADIDEQNNRIKTATARLDELSTEKFKLEDESRKIEVEVGPVKYIAQLIYGDQVDGTLLERSVRYVIMTLIFVFDPLAVLMLIASNQGLAEWRASRTRSDGIVDRLMHSLKSKLPAPKEPETVPEQHLTVASKGDPEGDAIMMQIKSALDDILPRTISIEKMVERTVDREVPHQVVVEIKDLEPIAEQPVAVEAQVESEPAVVVAEEQPREEVAAPTGDTQSLPRQEMVDTMRRVLFNAIEEITTDDVVPNDLKVEESTQDGEQDGNATEERINNPSEIGQVSGTEDLLNKLQRVHAVRLQRFNAKTN